MLEAVALLWGGRITATPCLSSDVGTWHPVQTLQPSVSNAADAIDPATPPSEMLLEPPASK